MTGSRNARPLLAILKGKNSERVRKMAEKKQDIIIIGAGPAGISAALYARRAGLAVTVVTKGPGALAKAEGIENYYGFAEPVTAGNTFSASLVL